MPTYINAGRHRESPAKGYVARGGVEPPTFRFSGGRSYQLSYLALVPMPTPRVLPRAASMHAVLTGLEPATSALTGRRALQLLHRTWLGCCSMVPQLPVVPPTGFEPVLPP